jgi:hypothetical protein
MPATDTQPDLTVVRLYHSPEAHRKLRRLAADGETNMAFLARQEVMEYLAAHSLKGDWG